MSREPIRLPRRIGPRGRTTEFPTNGWSSTEVERRITDESVEWLYVFDPQGQQIARFRGTPDRVDLSEELKGRAGGLYGDPLLIDHLLVHNHPPVTDEPGAIALFPPSPTDLLTVVELGVRELVVISGGTRYTVRRPGEVWPTDEYEMSRLFDAATERLRLELGATGGTQADAARRLSAILTRLSEEGWIDYGWTERAGGI